MSAGIEDAHSQLERVAGRVSRETAQQLLDLRDQFLRWSARINLAAPSTHGDLWTRHILDSAQLYALSNARRWLDIGSGGGFPGLVMAILLKERSGSIDLVESNRKKTGYLQAMVGQFSLPARVHPVRIEAANVGTGIEVVTARALAPLRELLPLADRWLAAGAVGLFHKGRDCHAEIAEIRDRDSYDLLEHASKVGDGGVILEVRKRAGH